MTAPDTSAFTQQFVEEARDRLKSLSDLMLRLEATPDSTAVIADIFREAHSLKGSAGMLGFADISQIAHQLEDLLAAAKLDARIMDGRAVDLVFRTIDVMSARVEELASGKAPAVSAAAVDQPSPPAQAETPSVVASGRAVLASLRVSVEKLENLTHLAPEMVTHRLNAAERHAELRRLEHTLGRLRDRIRGQRLIPSIRSRPAELGDYADALDEIHRRMRMLVRHIGDDHARLSLTTEDLRQQVMDLTMLPLSTVFDAFPRAVRDLARSCGKEVELTMTGGDTALDKRVIEQISEPLVHLVRNAVDHGLESAAERAAAGKSPSGSLHIAADHAGNRIRITVRDDGRGIDPAVVRAAAIRKGVVSEAQVAGWDDGRLRLLIFEPGFSTRSETTDVSGRGVGMDIVRVVAERIGGSVSVQSEVGRGTSLSLDLPVSLALMRVVLVEVGGEVLAVPTAPIKRILRVPSALRSTVEGALINVDGEQVPLVPLGVPLRVPGASLGATALLVEAGGTQAAFAVDAVREEQELVFQKLHGPLQQETIAGAALLGNGDIVPILNLQALVERVTAQNVEVAPPPRAVPPRDHEASGRVLIVEDSLVTGELLKGILVAAGYESAVAHHGLEAIDMLHDSSWDLVISDVDMPEMDGFALTLQVRADPALRNIPVIMVTSRDTDEYRRRGLAAGADEYVTKGSFDQYLMLDAVKRLLAGRRLDSASLPIENRAVSGD